MRKGFTLVELSITILMVTILTAVISFAFIALVNNWLGQEKRAGININLNRGIEEVARELRKAKTIQSANSEIRFTQDQSNYYIYYLYNANDTYPPNFKQDLYQLRRVALSSGINGIFTYGSGKIIIRDVLPPPVSGLSFSDNIVTIDISARRANETVRAKIKIRPRNI